SLLFGEAFRRCGIPVEVADRERLDRAPLFLALLALFDLARPAPRMREIMRALASPYFDFSAGGEAIDVRNLVTVLTREQLTGDLAAWTKTLSGRCDTLLMRAETSEDPDETKRWLADADRTRRAAQDLSRLHSLLAP